MKNYRFLFPSFVVLFFLYNLSALSQQELEYRQRELAIKLDELNKISNQITIAEQEYSAVTSELESTKENRDIKYNEYKLAKDSYERASKNADIITPQRLSELLSMYQEAQKIYNNSEFQLKLIESRKNRIENDLKNFKDSKQKKEIEILEIKANIFELELRKPIWVEGYGESIMDENKTMNDCKKMALEYAKRDAIEKGGKAIIESVTQVEMFRLIKDEIKSSIKVQIINQDVSGDYGKVKRVILGDVIKYVVSVRFEVQSTETYNPYLEKIKELKGIKIEQPPRRPDDQKYDISLSKGLVAYYPFNGNANDESGNGHHGSFMGVSLSADRLGNANYAASFNGYGNYIELPSSKGLINQVQSISFWIYFYKENFDDGRNVNMDFILAKAHDTGYQRDTFNRGSTNKIENYFGTSSNSYSFLQSNTIFHSNKWYHVVFTRDYNTNKVYINGELDAYNSYLGYYIADNDPLKIGIYHDNYNLVGGLNRWFNGKIDDFRIYSRSLMQDEVKLLYNEKK